MVHPRGKQAGMFGHAGEVWSSVPANPGALPLECAEWFLGEERGLKCRASSGG
jgi:hypothetical protein